MGWGFPLRREAPGRLFQCGGSRDYSQYQSPNLEIRVLGSRSTP